MTDRPFQPDPSTSSRVEPDDTAGLAHLQQRVADVADPALLASLDAALHPAAQASAEGLAALSALSHRSAELSDPALVMALGEAIGPSSVDLPEGLHGRVLAAVEHRLTLESGAVGAMSIHPSAGESEDERSSTASPVLARIGPSGFGLRLRRAGALAAVLTLSMGTAWWFVDRLPTAESGDVVAAPPAESGPPSGLDRLRDQVGEELVQLSEAALWAVDVSTASDVVQGASDAVLEDDWAEPLGDETEALWLELTDLRQAAEAQLQ
ncbi:MAG: hypothetical protein AAF288_07485 [Planctomycetota bacterium]